MYTFTDFQALKKDEQIYQILTQGILLAKKEADGFCINLYSLYDFYTEFRTKTIEGEIHFTITPLNQMPDLTFYINDIKADIFS